MSGSGMADLHRYRTLQSFSKYNNHIFIIIFLIVVFLQFLFYSAEIMA